ncbi:copper amine oxidase N-terminal domain-containing protein [Paenibacillus humicola]|uniref:copper amine oxidase N-terminal domain-containing protein n=1 Tax=Paenibacillus humicola TaxID=3110540 RepID=UPI00237A35D6|nr:copper amine oxidase N-terminal domain-containing protein [Paenibacillus humicola]
MRAIWKRAGLKLGLAVLLLGGAQALCGAWGTNGIAAAADNETVLPQNVWYADPAAKDGSIIRQGKILVPVRTAALQLQMGLYRNAAAHTVTLLNPVHRIVFQPGVRTAVVDGKKAGLDMAPVIVNGSLYVPFRFLAQTFGYPLGKRDSQYIMTFRNPYSEGQFGSETYWMNNAGGDLYYSNGTTAPARIGKLDMRIQGLGGISVEKTGKHSILLTVRDNYGEDIMGAHTDVYQALLLNNRVLTESKVNYTGSFNINNVKSYEGDPVMIDGSSAKRVDPDTGRTVKTYDMAALTGGNPKDSYDLEYVSDDILLIRPFSTSMLTAVDLETKQTTALYKKLLPDDQQKWLEATAAPNGANGYQGDGLLFVKRAGNGFEFQWYDPKLRKKVILKWDDSNR